MENRQLQKTFGSNFIFTFHQPSLTNRNFQNMSRGVIVIYRPRRGKDTALLQMVKDHLPILRTQDLVTDRAPIIMKAADGSIIEVFEWKSPDAIKEAHQNKVVLALWERFSEVCDYEIPVNVKEFHGLFSEFEILN